MEAHLSSSKNTENALAGAVGVSQAALHKLSSRADVGPLVARAVYRFLGMTAEEVVEKFGNASQVPAINLSRSVVFDNRNELVDAIGKRRCMDARIIEFAQQSIPAGRDGVVMSEELANALLDNAPTRVPVRTRHCRAAEWWIRSADGDDGLDVVGLGHNFGHALLFIAPNHEHRGHGDDNPSTPHAVDSRRKRKKEQPYLDLLQRVL